MTTARRNHWDHVYGNKAVTEVSWYQEVPDTSLALVESSGVLPQDAIIDIGGGASTLVDHLLHRGYIDLTVLDLASAALDHSRRRLGGRASAVDWVCSDVTGFEPQRAYGLWHDRAAMHFLTDSADLERYVDVLKKALKPDGYAIISTFGPDGPGKCSGLEIRRYNIGMLEELLGPEFELQSHELENHKTPMGRTQQFLYSCWIRRG